VFSTLASSIIVGLGIPDIKQHQQQEGRDNGIQSGHVRVYNNYQ
jgi:hypothetical protein